MIVTKNIAYSETIQANENGLSQINKTNSQNCRDLLQSNNLSYTEVDQYLQVGAIPLETGWVFYISVIRLEFTPLIKKLLPILFQSKLSFRIPKDKDTVRKILDGSLGSQNLLKTISIYPTIDIDLTTLAKQLVAETNGFRGPNIPATTHLGGCLYVEYQDSENQKIKQPQSWPFHELVPAKPYSSRPLWNSKYKPLAVIKPDLKGRVILANYFKGLFKIKLCIIKEGMKNMWADEFGRDIVDRLKWQHELYTYLAGNVLTPEIFDLFQEQDNIYLVMEYIKGDTLLDKINSIYNGRSWFLLSIDEKLQLISYILKLSHVVKEMHQMGLVHRDITPGNFILNKNDEMYLIDLELTYSIRDQKPDPPFKLGTEGYMSQEQRSRQKPTTCEDIFALGALMQFIFTGLSPLKINSDGEDELPVHLSYFTDDLKVINIICRCLSQDPKDRPDISTVISVITDYYQRSAISNASIIPSHGSRNPGKSKISTLIQRSLESLSSQAAMSGEGLWSSRPDDGAIIGVELEDRIPILGFSRGISGILFLLSRAVLSGYSIQSYIQVFNKNRDYLIDNFTSNEGIQSDKVTIAISEGIQSGLIPESYKKLLESYFNQQFSLNTNNLADGFAGVGHELLWCKSNLPLELFQFRIRSIIDQLLAAQRKDGSWDNYRNNGRNGDNIIGLAQGTAGIICFLTNAALNKEDEDIILAVRKGLKWLTRVANKELRGYSWTVSTKSKTVDQIGCSAGTPGICLAFIRAFRLLKEPLYKEIAENSLASLPKQPLTQDFTLASGLSGLGEVYVEAYETFETIEWQQRYNWIAGVFENTLLTGSKIPGYWSMNGFPSFDPELMTGYAGILHFLLRTQESWAMLTHPLIN